MKILRNAALRKLHLMFLPIIFGGLFFGSFQTAHGQITTFAQFFEKNGGQDFVFTNSSPTASFNTINGGTAIYFTYQNIGGLNSSLQGLQDAHLVLTSSTTALVTTTGSNLAQPFSNANNTIRITRDTAAPAGVGTGSRTNLLTVTFSPNNNSPQLTGSNGGNSSSFSATTPDHVVTFTSDFLNFSTTTARNFALSFSSVTPALSIGNGGFLSSFTAAGSGTFASNPVPTVVGPTAATVTISGRVLTSAGRGLRNALVTVTQADGSTRTILTNSSGRYSFADVEIPQTIIVSVISKTFIFNPRVFSLDSDFAEMDFIPVESKFK